MIVVWTEGITEKYVLSKYFKYLKRPANAGLFSDEEISEEELCRFSWLLAHFLRTVFSLLQLLRPG